MRVISGKYRGRRLESPLNDDIRPTSDLIKESVFDVIQFDIAGARFVDLFAGSGSIGIEAISRGASETIFVDNNRNSISLIQNNLSKIEGNFRVYSKDYRDFLSGEGKKFDFIFVDPPYKTDYIEEILHLVALNKLLNEDGYIIYEHGIDKKYVLPLNFCVAKRKQFGKINVDYITYAKSVCAISGSFDPITTGHWSIIQRASKIFDRIQLVIAKNPDKESFFDMQKRELIVKKCIEEYPNISVDICEGYIFEYCMAHGIKDIVRGYRDDDDLVYEQIMAEFNQEKGGITTHLMQSTGDCVDIRSSNVKELIKGGQPIKGLVPKQVEKYITTLYGEKL